MFRMIRFGAGIFLLICLLSSCGSMPEEQGTFTDEAVTAADLDEYIRLAPGVTHEMLNAKFWISSSFKNDDEARVVLMTEEEIARANEANADMLSTESGIRQALLDFEDTVDGAFVRELVSTYSRPKDVSKRFLGEEPTTQQFWDALENNCNMEAIPDTVSPQFGFCVRRTDVKVLPFADCIAEAPADYHYDTNAQAECPSYSPVVVLHESLDGCWYYIASESFSGWTIKENVALCASREDWLLRQKPEEFLVVTGRELRLAYDPYSPETSGLLLSMGTVLPLVSAEDAPDDFNGRASFGSYVTKLPVRDENGMIGDVYTLVPVSEDVHVGYLPYTCENLLNLAFKRQGDRYGWAGMYYANDCSGMLREMFACFGFKLPRGGYRQVKMETFTDKNLSSKLTLQKRNILTSTMPGALLYFPGHIMLYLGTYDGHPYAISAIGEIVTEGLAEGDTLAVNSVVVTNLDETYRLSGKTWLESMTDMLVLP